MTRPVTCPGRAYPPRRNGKVMRGPMTGLVIGVVAGMLVLARRLPLGHPA